MATERRNSRSANRIALVCLLAWLGIVLYAFALRHPVRAGGLWLEHLGGLCCNLFLLLGAIVLGRRILSWFHALPDRRGERLVFSLGLGFFAMTYLTLALGLAGALYRWTAWVLIAAPIVLAHRDTQALLEEGRDLIRETRGVGLATAALALLLTPLLLGTLWISLAPVSAHDALVYHLNLPKHYAEGHRISPLPLNVYSSMPHNLEVLTTLAFAGGGETAARAMDFVMRLAVCAAGFVLARRFLPPAGSLLAIALFLLNPIATSARTVGNIDLGMALFFLLSVLGLLRILDERLNRDVWITALFAGYLMGCKYTGVFYALSVAVFLLAAVRPPARTLALFVALLAAPVAPWLVKNLLTTGNPVYPLLPGWFPSREWDPVLGRQLLRWQRSMGMGRGLGDSLLLPWNATVEGQMGRNYRYFDGVLSPLPLAMLPLLALLKNRTPWLRLLGLAVIPFLGWAATSQQMRFLMPLLPLTAVVTAGIIWWMDREGLGSGSAYFRTFGVVMVVGCLGVFQLPAIVRNASRALPVVTGEVSRADYLRGVVQPYAVIERANQSLPPEARVLMIWENRGYDLERPYLADSFFEASQIARLAGAASDPASFADTLRARGVTHVIYNHGLGRFFEQIYPPQYARFLHTLVSEELEPLFSERDVTLYRVHP